MAAKFNFVPAVFDGNMNISTVLNLFLKWRDGQPSIFQAKIKAKDKLYFSEWT